MNSNIDSRGVIDASEPNHIDALRGEIGAAFSTSEYGDLNAEQERRVEQAIAIVRAHYDPLLVEARRTALASAPPPAVPDAVGVRATRLTWTKPTDHPQEDDEALWTALGLGGRYSISEEQSLHIGGRGHLLWWAHDGFTFAEFRTVDEAKAAAQADFDRRILSSIEPTPSPEPQAVLDRHQAMYDDWLAAALARPADEQFNAATALAANVGCVLANEPDHPDAPGPGGFERAAEAAFARSGGDTAVVTAEDYRAFPEPQASNAGAVEALERIFGNMAKLVINVEGWVSRGYSETATKAMREAMEDGWTQIGWKPYFDAQRATLTTPEPQTGERDGEVSVDAIAAFLHKEVEWPEDNYPAYTWPEVDGDTGQREGGYVKIVPKYVVEEFRAIARRLLIAFRQQIASDERIAREAAERRLAEVERAERARLFDLFERDPEQFTALCASDAALRAKPEAQAIVGKEAGE